jgi:hypothetical protein
MMYFPDMENSEKHEMLAEREQLKRLRESLDELAPLTIERVEHGAEADATILVRWGEREFRFAVECKSRSTPQILQQGIAQARAYANPPESFPMVMVPYLSRTQLLELERLQVSGLDACGNCLVVVPGEILVLRSGQPNKYPDSAPLKNVYRGDASLAPRVFVRRPEYPTVNAVRDEIRDRGGRIALSTVSKALKRLEDDLIIARQRGSIRLLQGDKLLEQLAANYQPPKLTQRPVVGRCSLPTEQLLERVRHICDDDDIRLAATGAGSVHMYATMAREPKVSLYCADVATVFNYLSHHIDVTDRFANLELLETQSEIAYFDSLPPSQAPFPWASPLQTYLELMQGDKRDQEAAGQVVSWLRDWNAEDKWGTSE